MYVPLSVPMNYSTESKWYTASLIVLNTTGHAQMFTVKKVILNP